MKWTKSKSIQLSLICTAFFGLFLFALDLFGIRLIGWYVGFRCMPESIFLRMAVTLYTASIFGWYCLWSLWRLLKNIRSGNVFTDGNVGLLRGISWCLAGAALIFLISGLYYLPFLIVSAGAAFIMLIVRVVKNVFQQANEMKTELDLTI